MMDDDRLERIERKLNLCASGVMCLLEAEGERIGCLTDISISERQELLKMILETFVEMFKPTIQIKG